MPIISAIFTFFSGWAARFLGVQALRFALWKGILWALVVSVFPTVLYNTISYLLGQAYQMYAAQASSLNGGQAMVVHLTGCAGNLAIWLQLPAAVSLILSAAMFRMAISMIPFVGRA